MSEEPVEELLEEVEETKPVELPRTGKMLHCSPCGNSFIPDETGKCPECGQKPE